jgi:hypothetical protein
MNPFMSDETTRHLPVGTIRSDLAVSNPELTWNQMSSDDKARFLLVALRTVGKKPLPDPHWHNLVQTGVADLLNGSLMVSPVGVFLLQWVVEHELAWVAEWTGAPSAE